VGARDRHACSDYYHWNQWIFLKMLERGLAYRKRSTVNWCPSCNTVLANEQVVDGACWRCGTPVTTRDLEQWFFKITHYADDLLRGMDELGGWPEKVLTMQRNWIGRSEGARVRFPIETPLASAPRPSDLAARDIEVFTTRIDTIYGANHRPGARASGRAASSRTRPPIRRASARRSRSSRRRIGPSARRVKWRRKA
jgi:leucyl-tRNA synthetase